MGRTSSRADGKCKVEQTRNDLYFRQVEELFVEGHVKNFEVTPEDEISTNQQKRMPLIM